jgi:hypothetical protein
MSTSSFKPGQPAFISDGASADAIVKEYIEAPFAAAQQPALNTGLQLLAFMSALPEAFIASEQRELKRLAKTTDNTNDARIERVQLSLERAADFHASAVQAKTRIDRALLALSTEEKIFHGFVSDMNLKPLEKLTVRISALSDGVTGSSKDTKSLSTTTDADGYFSISLGKEKNSAQKSSMPESSVKLSEQIAARLASVNAKAKIGSGENIEQTRSADAYNKEVLAQVEILDATGKLLHQDSTPLVINNGSAYREYILDANAPPTSAGKLHSPTSSTDGTRVAKKAASKNSNIKTRK